MKAKLKKYTIVLAIITPLLLTISLLLAEEQTNPPVNNTVKWDSNSTKDYFYRACADCHSNETKWPWYSHFAPISQLVTMNVQYGRSDFNISEKEMGESAWAARMVERDNMPPEEYLGMHPEADLTEKEKQEFIQGLKKTFGNK